MKFRYGLPVAALAAVSLAGCANQLENVRNAPPAGDQFARGLHSGYVELAQMEQDEYDWMDMMAFTDRASMASSGADVMPEAIAARDLPKARVGELTAARARLVKALDAGGREAAPMDAAHAQVMFDCWMQEQEEDLQPEDIKRCRAEFMAAMDKVEGALMPEPEPEMTKAPEPEPEMMEEPEPLPDDIVVYFAFDSAELKGASDYIITNAANIFKEGNVDSITLMGHADKSGSNDYNAKLAEKRLKAVRAALIEKGIPSHKIDTRSYGEDRPAEATPDGVENAKNRRVEFIFNP